MLLPSNAHPDLDKPGYIIVVFAWVAFRGGILQEGSF